MQTILGAGGAVGIKLANELRRYTDKIRLVGRNPKKVNENDELFVATLTDPQGVDNAVAGSDVVYLIVGLKYKLSVWEQEWEVIMRNTINACKKHNAKLVFLDNVYMYDRDYLSNMTEETPVRPTSKKGEIRAKLANMLLDEIKTGSLTALIARSADFAAARNSVCEMIYTELKNGKAAPWLVNADKIHTLTSASDVARGLAILGNTPDAFGQAWHLPTSNVPTTGREWIELIAKEIGVPPKISVLPVGMMGILGLFIPVLKEIKEMSYQNDRDYVFNSSKFNTRFNYTPQTPQEIAGELVKELNLR